ncbi:WapI family immunity protein [Modestobacter sp. SYSU DS0290]
MQLTSSDGASVELRPTRYQFSAPPSEPGDWDANWLEVHGRVRTATGESWRFDDPCLTTWEARQLGDWLRAAADGRVPELDAPTEDSEELLTFTEPNLGFSVGARQGDFLVVRVHLSLESVADRPGAGEEAPYDFYASGVPLRVGREQLLAAALAWDEDNGPFPER